MGFEIFVQLRCPKCGEVRDNPLATHDNTQDPPVFRTLINAVATGEPCERCSKSADLSREFPAPTAAGRRRTATPRSCTPGAGWGR